jgi:peptide/nickel transport system permease protein
MLPLVCRPAARALLSLLGVCVAVFAATELLPGDAAEARARGGADAGQLAELRHEAGLDRPPAARFADWLAGLARGDAGVSLISGRPVADLVAERLPATVTLAGCALALTVPLMVALACWAGAGTRSGHLAAGVAAAVAVVPQVVVAGSLAGLFAGVLGWLPRVSLLPAGQPPWRAPDLLVLPVLCLALPAAAWGAGLLAGAVADARLAPHVDDATLRGVPAWRVAAVHVLPLVVAPALRVLAVVTGGLLAGTTVVETIFGYRGLGELLVASVGSRDVPVVQAVAVLSAAAVLALLLAADIAARLTRPRRGAW